MLRPCLTLLALATVVAASLTSAAACPAPPNDDPKYRCTKYDHMMQHVAPQPMPQRYVRARPLYLPRRLTAAAAMRVLVRSRWIVEGAAGGLPALRLLDGADVPEALSTTDANVIVRAVTWQAGHFRVELNGASYQLERCRDARRRATACLTPFLVGPTP
ncbi:MAG: hypothetical protein IPL61_00910 [Myxococcales bacterium]|nr:hypothetical protein [Myxococcales bacterium]